MKNKLLLSSALVGSLVASSISFAETKITGSLDLSYNAKSASAGINSDNGFGRETQINIAKSGDLNNGMKYAAGFSLEFDGDGTSTGAQKSRENIYINLIAGGITYSVSADHVSNLDSSAVPRVSIPANSVAVSSADYAYAQGASLFTAADVKSNVKESFGLGVSGSGFTAYYVPQLEDFGGGNDSYGSSNGGNAYMLNYKGNAGVQGLNLNIGYAKADKAHASRFTSARDVTLQQASVAYNFGQITVGAGRIEAEDGVAVTSATAKDKSTDDFGVTFAVNDKLSVGLNYAKTDIDTTAEDEEITMAQIGYNLGAIGVAASYMQVENVKGLRNSDDDVFNIRLSTRF
jgi:hypothetical protein